MTTDPKTIAYADPPYLGMCDKYDHHHEAPWGCWDDIETHRQLFAHLDSEYDGWAVSLQSTALRTILPIAPEKARVGAWVKPWVSFRKGSDPHYAWEPVVFVNARSWKERGGDAVQHPRDFIVASLGTSRELKTKYYGQKPQAFCHWILDITGHQEGDIFRDLFPGSGAIGAALAQHRLLV